MKRKDSDISLLLTILVLFSASIGLLHGFKFSLKAAEDTTIVPQLNISKEDAFDSLTMPLASGNIPQIYQILSQYDPETQKKITSLMLENRDLSEQQKMQFLLGAAKNAKTTSDRESFFEILAERFPENPVLVAISPDIYEIVSSLASWGKKEGAQAYKGWKRASLVGFIEANDFEGLRNLYIHGLRFSPKKASLLLLSAIDLEKDPAFIPLLINQFKANPNYARDGKTAIIKAVEKNNPILTRVLLNHGANPDLVVDSSVGSANQIAQALNLDEIQTELAKF